MTPTQYSSLPFIETPTTLPQRTRSLEAGGISAPSSLPPVSCSAQVSGASGPEAPSSTRASSVLVDRVLHSSCHTRAWPWITLSSPDAGDRRPGSGGDARGPVGSRTPAFPRPAMEGKGHTPELCRNADIAPRPGLCERQAGVNAPRRVCRGEEPERLAAVRVLQRRPGRR